MTGLENYPWPSTCVDQACSLRDARIPPALAAAVQDSCPSCRGPLTSLVHQLTDQERRVLRDYPLPIAAAVARALAREEVESRIKALTDAFAEALRLTALVVKSEYLHSDCIDADVNQIITRDLARPLVSSWKKLSDSAIPALVRTDHPFFAPQLRAFHDRHLRGGNRTASVRLPSRTYDTFGDQEGKPRRMTPVGALLNFRNAFAHGHAHDEDSLRDQFELHLGLLFEVLEDMTWWPTHQICRETPTSRTYLTGLSPRIEPARTVSTQERLFLTDGDGRELDLYPFLIAPGAIFSDALAGEELLVYEQNTGRRIFYVSAAGLSRSTRATVATWQQLMRRKQAPQAQLHDSGATADDLAARASSITRQTRSTLYESRKLLEGVYAPRPALDEHLAAWTRSGYPLLAIAGTAGSGKTALINHAAETWQQQGHSVLLLRAQNLGPSRLELILPEELGLSADSDLATLLSRTTDTSRQLIVVIDGANEHREYADLMCSSVELASTLQGVGCLRVAVTFRSDIADWFLEKQDPAVLAEASASGQTRGFHNQFYMRRNADVRNVYGGEGDARPHFEDYGRGEGRMPNPFSFDARYYARRYASDPQVADLQSGDALFEHYRRHGVRRGYRPNHFGLMKHVSDNDTLLFEDFTCLQCGANLPRDERGRFDIWINSNEEPEPRPYTAESLELRFYKFCSLSCAQEKERNIPVIPSRGNTERGLFYPPLDRGSDALSVDDRPATLVDRLGPEETRSMWETYVSQGGAAFRPLFDFDELSRASTALQSDLANPLLLRTFLQLHAGRQLPESVSRCNLLDAWFERLGSEDDSAQELLMDIARICLEQERSTLDLDELFQDPRTAPAMREVHVGSTYTLLSRRHGVLGEYPRADRIEISFQVESFFEYVLGRVLEQDGDAATPGRLAARARQQTGSFALMRGAVAMALERQTSSQGTQFLFDFIDDADEVGIEIAGALLGRLASRGGVAELVAGLLECPTRADLASALAAAKWLTAHGHRVILGELLDATLRALPPQLSDCAEERSLRAAMADHLARTGMPGAAARQQQFVVEESRRSHRKGGTELAAQLERAGRFLMGIHRIEEALAAYQEAASMHAAAGPAGSLDAALAQTAAARLLVALHRPIDARAGLEAALDVLEQAFGPEHIETVQIRSILGLALAQVGEMDEGLALCRRALTEAQRDVTGRRASYVDQIAHVAACHELRGENLDAERFSQLTCATADRLGGDEAKRRAMDCRLRLLRNMRRRGETDAWIAAIEALRTSPIAADGIILARALMEGDDVHRSEAVARLEGHVERGDRAAMLELAAVIEARDPEAAEGLRKRARSFRDERPEV